MGGIDRIEKLLSRWESLGYGEVEKVRGLVDLFFVSVLLDAGAGDTWHFKEPESGVTYTRSEGIAVASLHMYLNGAFANSDSKRKDIVHGEALQNITVDALRSGFQVNDDTNPLVGISGRAEILQKLGKSFLKLQDIYGVDGRPGGLAGKSDKSP